MPQAMLNYGTSLLHVQDVTRATQTFERVLRQFPNSPQAGQAGVLVGDALVIQQRCEDAKEAFKGVLNGNDRMLAAQAQLSLAQCYQNSADPDTAVAEYLKMIYLYSDQQEMVDQATLSAAGIYEQLGKITEARNLYQKLVKTASTPELVQQAQKRLQALQ